MNVYAYIAAAIVLAGFGVYVYHWRKDKVDETPPPPPRENARPPPMSKPSVPKSAEQVFRETFPVMRPPPPA